jgi:gamma-F420-2:alpha-L-glutamate ligase
VLIVGGKVLGAMKRTAPSGDFRANITNGGTGEAYPVTPEIAEIALNAANVLKLDIAGIDLLFDSKGFHVCEANSNPGFSGFEKYCNTDVAGAIVSFIESKLS